MTTETVVWGLVIIMGLCLAGMAWRLVKMADADDKYMGVDYD